MNDNFWEGTDATPIIQEAQAPTNFWEGTDATPINAQARTVPEEGDSWPALIGKSALKGLGYAADLPNLAAQGLEGLARGGAEAQRRQFESMGYPGSDIETPEVDVLSSNIPTSEDAREFLREKTGIDLEPRPDTGAKRIAMHAAELAAPSGLFGMLGRGAKAAQALGAARSGAGIGATSGLLQEGGVNPLVADIGSAVAAPYTAAKLNPQNILSAFQKVPIKAMGLSPKGLKIEAAQAARDIGVDLPAAALTDSTLTGLADQWLGKTPFFSNTLKKKYATTEDQLRGALDDIIKRVGPEKSPETASEINRLYDLSKSALPEGAVIKPTNLDKAIDGIKFKSLTPTPDELSVEKTLKTISKTLNPGSSLHSTYGKIKIPLQEVGVDALIDTKKSLNAAIKWDTEEGVKNILRKIQSATAKDITKYGKANPEWYKAFKDADNMYGKVAKRASLEKVLEPTISAATDTLSFNALSKAINSGKNTKVIRKLEPELFTKIQKIGKVAQAMAVKSKNIPNPSGTAVTAATMGLVGGVFANPMALLTLPVAGSIVSTGVVSKLLTDKRFINLALKLAEAPNKPNLMTTLALNKRVKEITGYSALALSKELEKRGDE